MNARKQVLLIVEDDGWTRQALASILRHKGCEVLVAGTVAEGLERLNLGPDCVILDLSLPDGSGESILRRVRENRLDCRVVVCTAIQNARRLDAVRLLLPDAILVKPVEVDEILSACGSEGCQ